MNDNNRLSPIPITGQLNKKNQNTKAEKKNRTKYNFIVTEKNYHLLLNSFSLLEVTAMYYSTISGFLIRVRVNTSLILRGQSNSKCCDRAPLI